MIRLEEKLTDLLDFTSGSKCFLYFQSLFGILIEGGVAYKVFLDSGYALGKGDL
jgi:hypothetical protein